MDTASIRYRVVDFLKKHPPFHAIDDEDLLSLAAGGRVRFHEPNEYLLWQGEPHKVHVFVIQHGTVSLWDDSREGQQLRDVRGPGDMLGIERFTGARACVYSARSSSEVVVYGFPAADFEAILDKYPQARRYVSAHGGVTIDDESVAGRRDAHEMYLHDVAKNHTLVCCREHVSIRDAARSMRAAGVDAIAVVDGERRALGVLTSAALIDWVANGDGRHEQPVTILLRGELPALGPDASVADGVLAMGGANAPGIAMTTDGSLTSPLHALVTPGHLAPVFGEEPASLLAEIGNASNPSTLKALNIRARTFALRHLTGASAVDWLARFLHLVDKAIVDRTIVMNGDVPGACWCFCGSAGRAESITAVEPRVAVITEAERASALSAHERVSASLAECGYLARSEVAFDRSVSVASSTEWTRRFVDWIGDPVRQQTYRVRFMFDLRPIRGPRSLWEDLDAAVNRAVDRDFVRVLANDCLSSLPPLTFFQDAVVDDSGEATTVFRLKESALQPLVDVGRVFGLAGGRTLGCSTRERFAGACTLLPSHESIFREAADTMSVVLWQRARIGIAQGTSGDELPPELLGRYDRQVLKSGFRSIRRLLEFTADWSWLDAL